MAETRGDARTRLTAKLGPESVMGLDALSEEDLADLADALEAAERAEREALAEATEQSLSFVPGFLRGAVKKMVYG